MAGRPLAFLTDVSVEFVKGIGPAAKKKLDRAGINSVADLLLHVPRRYLDRSQMFDLSSVPLDEEVTVGGTVVSVNQRRISKGRLMTTAQISDGTNVITCTWFRKYMKLPEGAEILLSGKVERWQGRLQMKNPDWERWDESEALLTGRVVPVHPAAGGISPMHMRAAISNALMRSRPITEILPASLINRVGVMRRDEAFASVHFPETQDEAWVARHRLVFDELFRLEISLAMQKQRQIDDAKGIRHDSSGEMVGAFVDALPYELTGAQARSIDEIQADMVSQHPMHRLLQGEVGSGKTVVAVAALLTGVQSGYQGAVMAPTEVLAEQHYLGIRDLLEDAGLAPTEMDPIGNSGTSSLFADAAPTAPAASAVKMALLTSNNAEVNFLPPGTAKRSDVISWIADGEIDLVVGTHALIQEGVAFMQLGIAVVDEQHRFGVYQRVQLREKAEDYDPDLLIMTATPIPRTLAMTLYGDLDVSVLDEMPSGRIPVRTVHKTRHQGDLAEVYELVRQQAAEGRQAFVVCPLVDESDKLEVTSATEEFVRLQGVFPDLTLGLIHGQLRPVEKDGVMNRFRSGEIDVLVATTVIEVGIDIPNATLMIIEDADRFGLSQLHQLRGRVGRGAHASTCILVAEPTTPQGEERLAAMVATTDGFRLAEEDLRIRGQGTVFGERQAGAKDLKLADILRDAKLLVKAREEAFALVAEDPNLDNHPMIRDEVVAMLVQDVDWLFRS
ncbi:MAG: ATP-dependent DNA helicase RecG [bacterium]|nr:ATP-dependent DNA helicase RecG [bacterium]